MPLATIMQLLYAHNTLNLSHIMQVKRNDVKLIQAEHIADQQRSNLTWNVNHDLL